jgi:hypothetical protein
MEQSTALRAEWLARLSDAIEGAQRVAWQPRTYESASLEARELYSRLETARLELESLRGVAMQAVEKGDPDWLYKLGWGSSLLERPD